MHEGCNVFFFQDNNTNVQRLLEILTESLDSCRPRFVLVIPKETLPFLFLEIATFASTSPLFSYDYSSAKTDARFRERTHPQHSPRALSNQPLNVNLRSISSLH